jgi:hypothetical protein
MYLAAVKRGAATLVSFVMISIGLVLMSWGYTPVIRAQIFTYFFFALSLLLAEYARKENKYVLLLWLLPIHILWCNLHGGFVSGLGLLALYALGEGLSGRRFMPFVLILTGSLLVTFINPYGFDYWRYLMDAISMTRPDITEWHSVFKSIREKTFAPPAILFLFLSAASIFAIILHGKKYLTELIIIVILIYLGAKHIRHTVFLGIAFGIFMPSIVMKIRDAVAKNKLFSYKMKWLTPLLLIFFYLSVNLFVSRLPAVAATQNLSKGMLPAFTLMAPSPIFPSGALKWMENNAFEGNILPLFQWGQYLIWATHPKCKVAMDGRYETVYPSYIQKEYFDFYHGRDGWKTFLDKYPHDAVLLMPNTKIHYLILKEPDWQKVYSDPGSVLFLRRDIIRK